MITFAGLCRDLFLMAQLPGVRDAGGLEWERLVEEHLSLRGVRTDVLPGGCSLLGFTSLSGLRHQLDGTIASRENIIVGEWKAYRGAFPKNELIRFKGVSDDLYLGLRGEHPARPIMRVFGGPGLATRELRRYAAIWGITIIDSKLWPAPVLASDRLMWSSMDCPRPSDDDHERLTWLSRAFQRVLIRRPDGSFELPRLPTTAAIEGALDRHDFWSERLWASFDSTPGRFEALLGRYPLSGSATS